MGLAVIDSAWECVSPPSFSPCGRQFHFGGRIAQDFVNVPTKFLKITLFALGVLGWFILIKIQGILPTQAAQIFSPIQGRPILNFCLDAVRFVVTSYFIGKILDLNLYNEILGQKKERELIEALGGQEAFDNLPEIRNSYRLNWDLILPSDVDHLPISVRRGENFVVVLCLREKGNPDAQPFALALCSYLQYYTRVDGWKLFELKHPPGIFNAGRDRWGEPSQKPLETFLPIVKMLVQGLHPSYELVAPIN